MTLVDTSVWIDHWRRGNARLVAVLESGRVALHPFVIGELSCGSLPKRATTIRLLEALPQLAVARHTEVMSFVEHERLAASGIGWTDAHLLAAARLSSTPVWTLDRALGRAAKRLGLFNEPEL